MLVYIRCVCYIICTLLVLYYLYMSNNSDNNISDSGNVEHNVAQSIMRKLTLQDQQMQDIISFRRHYFHIVAVARWL